MSFAAVQKHVVVLERADLLSKQKRGREVLARGNVDAIRSATTMLQVLEANWRGRIASVDELLEQDDESNSS